MAIVRVKWPQFSFTHSLTTIIAINFVVFNPIADIVGFVMGENWRIRMTNYEWWHKSRVVIGSTDVKVDVSACARWKSSCVLTVNDNMFVMRNVVTVEIYFLLLFLFFCFFWCFEKISSDSLKCSEEWKIW